MKDIPIVVLTADATADQARRLRGAGAFEYMTKPLEIGEVLRLVDDRLRASDRDAEIQSVTLSPSCPRVQRRMCSRRRLVRCLR